VVNVKDNGESTWKDGAQLATQESNTVQSSRKKTYWETWDFGSTERLATGPSRLIFDGIEKIKRSSSNVYNRRIENRRTAEHKSDTLKISSSLFG
jgi:hypothetical protein